MATRAMNVKLTTTQTTRQTAAQKRRAGEDFYDFAVGLSHKPLPKRARFAIVTDADGPGITATVADVRFGPDCIEAPAKLPPAATFLRRTVSGEAARCVSITGKTAVGPQTITNGVKQQWLGVRFPGVELT